MFTAWTALSFSKTKSPVTRRQSWLLGLSLLVLAVFLPGLHGQTAPAGGAATVGALPCPPGLAEDSLRLARRYLVLSQRGEGYFFWQYNIRNYFDLIGDDGTVQASVLWALVEAEQRAPGKESQEALALAWPCFRQFTTTTPDLLRFLAWPEEKQGQFTAEAAYILALSAHLAKLDKGVAEEERERLVAELTGHLRFLLVSQDAGGQFRGQYALATGEPTGDFSPMADAACLLALLRAESVLGHEALRGPILKLAAAFNEEVLRRSLYSALTQPAALGSFPLGSLALAELHQRPWAATLGYGDLLLKWAGWVLSTTRLAEMRSSTAQLVPGFLAAETLAKQSKQADLAQRLLTASREILQRTMARQIGGPLGKGLPVTEESLRNPRAIGGVIDNERPTILRLDHGQHLVQALVAAGAVK